MTDMNGMTPQQKARYENKLVGADLTSEKQRAQALVKEAQAEKATNPQKAAQVAAIAHDRLSLIAAEQKQRTQLQHTFSDGSNAGDYAKSLENIPESQLAAQEKSLKAAAGKATGPIASDAKMKLLAVNRERERRTGVNQAAAAQKEQARLEGVKKDFASQLAGASGAELKNDQALENVRLQAAQDWVSAAKSRLDSASGPGERAVAQAALKQAEAGLRTEYARHAVLDANTPVKLNHQALHNYANTLKSYSPDQLQAERAKVASQYADMTTGAMRGSRDDTANAKVKLAIIDAAIARSQGKPTTGPTNGPTTVQGPTDKSQNGGIPIFKGAGAFVVCAPNMNIDELKKSGVKWVGVQAYDPTGDANGQQIIQGNLQWVQAHRQELEDAGIKVGFWGCNRGNPVQEADEVSGIIQQYKPDFYVADAEFEYAGSNGPGQPTPDKFARSKQFVDEFRRLNPDLPSAVSSYRSDMDWKPWQDAGFDYLPQAYQNVTDNYSPQASLDFAKQVGWTTDRVHPTFGCYKDVNGTVPIQTYLDEARQTGTKGYSVYPAEYLSDSDWQAVAQANAQGDLTE